LKGQPVTPGLVDKVEAVDLVEVELLELELVEVELLELELVEVELLELELVVELLEVVVVVVVEVTNVCSSKYLLPDSSRSLSPVSKCMKVSAILPQELYDIDDPDFTCTTIFISSR
jgi:hypothetical protein